MNRAERRRCARQADRPARSAPAFADVGLDLEVLGGAGCTDDKLHQLMLNAVIGGLTRWGPWPGALDGDPIEVGCGCLVVMRVCNDRDSCPLCTSDWDHEDFRI